MSRDWKLYFDDLIDFCQRVLAYTEGMSREQFEASQLNYDATVRNVELMGEAAKNIPEYVQARMPTVPWREIIGIRNVLAHGYFGVDNNILWHTIQHEVPSLLNSLEAYKASHGQQTE